MRAGCALAILAFPAIVTAAYLLLAGHWPIGSTLSSLQRAHVMLNAVLTQTAAAAIAAPIAGSWLVSHDAGPSGRSAALRDRGLHGALVTTVITAACALLFAVSYLATSWPIADDGVRAGLLPSAALLWAATFALLSIGAWTGSLFADPLDGASCAAVASLVAAGGALLLGPLLAGAPVAVIDGALLASPIVAVASAASFDLLRTDMLYRVSPLAHVSFHYPAWSVAFGVYLGVAAACVCGFLVNVSRRAARRNERMVR